MSQPLTGQELLRKLQEMDGALRTEKCRACGYFSFKKDGSERLNLSAFYRAIVDAQNPELLGNEEREAGSRLGYVLTAGERTGHLVVSKGYLELIGVRPLDQVVVRVEDGSLILSPAEPGEGSAQAGDSAGTWDQPGPVESVAKVPAAV